MNPPGTTLPRPEKPPTRWTIATALAYPAALVLLLVVLRWVGERWWLTTVGLFVPWILLALPLPLFCLLLWRRGPRRLLVTQGVAALLLLFPLGGFVLPWPARPDPRAPIIRVLSYNVMHGYGGPDRIVAEIDRFAPDIVLLQKLYANIEPVGDLLNARYPHVEWSAGAMVASRFPILSRIDPDDPLPDDESAVVAFIQRVIATPLGPIAFYDCHPTSAREGLMAAARLQREAAKIVRAETALRVGQVRRLSARARQETIPVVIAGDTNLTDLSPLLRAELSRYRDGFREAGWGFGYTYPFNLFPWMRLDRILAGDSLRFVRFQIGSSDASDHLCVVAAPVRIPALSPGALAALLASLLVVAAAALPRRRRS